MQGQLCPNLHADFSQGPLPILVPSPTDTCLGLGSPWYPASPPQQIHSLNSLPWERLSKSMISIKTVHELQGPMLASLPHFPGRDSSSYPFPYSLLFAKLGKHHL